MMGKRFACVMFILPKYLNTILIHCYTILQGIIKKEKAKIGAIKRKTECASTITR